MSKVNLEKVSKRFPGGNLAVDDISLDINDREFLVLIGPSGCGKSTTLRLMAGLETCTDGNIRIGDRVVNDVAPKDRDIAMVFQNYALYPHMSVYNNLSFGLRLRFGGGIVTRVLRRLFNPGRATELEKFRLGIDQQVRQTASRLGIEHLLNRKPHQLSGGERQRVALGRAIVRNPAAFLFDEPLSNLDAKLRQKMRIELKRLHREMQATMIYVTHDQVEAMTLGDRVAVMNHGKILQIGPPLSIYEEPANLFVARFIGTVPINLQTGELKLEHNRLRFKNPMIDLELDPKHGPAEISGDSRVVIGFRAENVSSVEKGQGDVEGKVEAIDRLGDATILHVDIGDSNSTESQNFRADDDHNTDNLDNLKLVPRDNPSLVVRTTPDERLSPGQTVALTINPEKLIWFDEATGLNLGKK